MRRSVLVFKNSSNVCEFFEISIAAFVVVDRCIFIANVQQSYKAVDRNS